MELFEPMLTAKCLYAYLLYFCWNCKRGESRVKCGAPVCTSMTLLAADMILRGEY